MFSSCLLADIFVTACGVMECCKHLLGKRGDLPSGNSAHIKKDEFCSSKYRERDMRYGGIEVEKDTIFQEKWDCLSLF